MADKEEVDKYADMSDEDFDKLSAPEVKEEEETVLEKDEEKEEEELPPEIDEEEEEQKEEKKEDDPASEEKEEETATLEEEGDTDNDETSQKEEEELPEKEKEKTEEKETKDKLPEIDYKAAYEQIMAPFNANGGEITPKSLADVRRFQEMGANYHKKMVGMKPALKALKTLENNGLLDESKLDFLIDLHLGKPEAITKLLKDSKIDPLDVDVSTETTYTPTSHSASDNEIALDTVLGDIQGSPNYNKTLTTVTKEWDEASRSQAATNPQIIQVINGHMDSGVYDKVMAAVNYDRSVGNLSDVSDLEAYKIVGNRLEQEGAFKQAAPATKVIPPKPDPIKEEKRKAQKKAAGPTKTTSKTSKLPANFNPLSMSDEEFQKFDKKLLGL